MKYFRYHFPITAALILNPVSSLIVALLLGGVLALFSVHYALSVVIVWLALFSFYLDRRLLDYVLLTPFAMIAVWQALGLGVGAALRVFGEGLHFSRELFIMQVAYIACYPAAFAGYACFFHRVKGFVLPAGSRGFGESVLRPLVWIGWSSLFIRVVQLVLLAATGAADRGDLSARASGEVFGVWTFLTLFQRAMDFGFLLVPLLWMRSGLVGRLLLAGVCCVYFTVATASGARGIVLYPIAFIIAGAFLFAAPRRVRLEPILMGAIVLAVPFVVAMDHFRNTDAYRATSTINLPLRLRAFTEVRERSSEFNSQALSLGGNLSILGGALVGVSDDFIFAMTPDVVPYAGIENYQAVFFTWIPTFFARDKVPLIDSNAILYGYMGESSFHTGRAISLYADAFRRFGWAAMPIALFLAFLVYGAFCAFAYNTYLKRNALLGILLILLTFSFFVSRPFGTVLSTWWTWAYDIPKHLLLLAAVYLAARLFLVKGEVEGALAYASSADPERPTGAGDPSYQASLREQQTCLTTDRSRSFSPKAWSGES